MRMETTEKRELLSLYPSEIEEWMIASGEAKYRAGQLFPQLHRGLCPDEMTNLGKKLQEKLLEESVWHLATVE
jgi:adenine C2-methylase RlmN of 23S rRNA A2503 and tRNA A37